MEILSHETAAPIDWEKARPLLDDAIGELDEKDREAILLRFFEGRDFSSIGARLQLSDNAARMRVERALEKLRTRLERCGVTSTATVIATVLAQQTAVAMPAGLATSVTSVALAAGAVGSGAAAGFGSSAAITLMSLSKLQIGMAGALAVAAATGLVIQGHRIAGLRSEIANRQQQNQEVVSLQIERQRLMATAVEVAALRQDDVALAQLRDEATALQVTLQKVTQMNAAKRAATPTSRPRPTVSVRTSDAFKKLKPLQERKDWSGMMSVLDGLVSQVGPTSYDMALILDMKAKLYAMQNQFSQAIEPWEKALQLSDQFKYFEPKMSRDIATILAQLRYQAGLTKQPPPTHWF
jgi:hypothetical protein